MKKVLFLLIAFFTIGYGQSYNWGAGNYPLGQTFLTTDSLKMRPQTYLILPDTLYTNALDKSYSFEDGVYKLAFDAEPYAAADSTIDSIYVDMRLGYNFGTFRTPVVKWDAWKNLIGPVAASTLTTLNIAQSDSSWYGPSNIIQYRVYGYDEDVGTDADSVLIYLTDFRH